MIQEDIYAVAFNLEDVIYSLLRQTFDSYEQAREFYDELLQAADFSDERKQIEELGVVFSMTLVHIRGGGERLKSIHYTNENWDQLKQHFVNVEECNYA